MVYHLIIDSSFTLLDFHDFENLGNRRFKKIKSLEVIFLDEEITEVSSSISPMQALGSNLYINSMTHKPYFPIFWIPLLDTISFAIQSLEGQFKPSTDDLPTTVIVISLTDDFEIEPCEFGSVVAAIRKVKPKDGELVDWVFRTFHASIDTVSIAAEMTNTNHFITMFEKREMEQVYWDTLNIAISDFYK